MQVIMQNGERAELEDSSAEALEVIRHSASHVMAAAITQLFGHVEFGVGPAIENGFYYDMRLEHTFTPEDFEAIEAKMAEIIKSNLPFVRKEITREEARELFADQPFKLELIDELPEDEMITTFSIGDFTDLCAGPHVTYTKKIKAFKLMKLAGAYWRGDAEREHLRHGLRFQARIGAVSGQP